MDVAEDVVFGTGFGNGQIKILAPEAVVQVAVCRAVGDQEVDVFRKGNGRFQVWPCRDTVELDSVKFQSFVLQTDNAVRKQSSCPCRILVEDTVVVTGDDIRSLAGMDVYQSKKSFRSAGLKPSQASPEQMRMSASDGTESLRYIPWVSENAKIV